VIKFGENNSQECVKRIFIFKLFWAQMLHQFAKKIKIKNKYKRLLESVSL
jgi:hypothetical protein